MRSINIKFSNEQEKIDFVVACEQEFEKMLDEACAKAEKSGVMNLLLSGPTCSGKTTTANKLIEDFEACQKSVTIISIDDFFHERTEGRVITEDTKIDYDSVDVIDLPLLSDCIKHAKPGNTIIVPQFDFITQSRSGYNKHEISDNEIIIFEGIQAVYPEIVSQFDTPYVGIFINVSEDVCINGVEFSKNEIRFIRRVVRDRKFRGASADFTFFLWESVRENEEKSIFPNMDVCEIKINSFLAYELFLMRDYLINTLNEVNQDSKYYDKAQALIKKVESLDSIDYEYIPKNSLYTEFLGKK